MRLVHLSSELATLIKVGGLGDVLFGLSRAQSLSQKEVTVLLPYYKTIDISTLREFRKTEASLPLPCLEKKVSFSVWEGFLGAVRVVLLDLLSPDLFFQRPQVYGYKDDAERFLSFSLAASIWIAQQPPFALLHLHDWPTAVLPAWKERFKIETPTLLTLHNLAHRGEVEKQTLFRFGLESFAGKSLLEVGIETADGISAVSSTYLQEIQTAEGGAGLDALLRQKLATVPSAGILNGIDASYWDPASPLLSRPFPSLLRFEKQQAQCQAKRQNKHALQKELGLEVNDCPLVVCVSRLVPQKGLDLIEQGLFRILEKGGNFILLGKSPIRSIEEHFQRLANSLSLSARARLLIDYTERSALRLFAAADLVFVPSLFEPCGLTQLIGFRFGALAIARETGGLKESVIDLEHHPKADTEGNGFTFLYPDFEGVAYAIDRALESWKNPLQWRKWVRRVLAQDVSWALPEKRYETLYKTLVDRFELSNR